VKKTALLLACLLFCACKAEQRPSCPELDGGAPVDQVLLAFLSGARSAHHAADASENVNDARAALIPLGKLVNGPLPPAKAGQLAPEVREVLADTRARMADLESQLGDFDGALADVARGKELAVERGYFRGHLFETEGLIEERRAKALKASDPVAASAAEKRAMSAFEEAMAIQGSVIQGAAPASSSPVPERP
jgi:hypothetical protein